MHFRALLINTPVHHSPGTSHQLITLPVHTSCLSMLLSHSIFIWEAAETKWAVFYHLYKCALRTLFTTGEASPHPAGKTQKWAIIINVRARFCISGYSLVQEGKQVAHHHQRRPWDTQQDLTDTLRSLVQVFYPCSRKMHII